MEDQILNGIVARLSEIDSTVPIYTEQIKQGFFQPAFFVMQLDTAQAPGYNRRSSRNMLFNVHYFPDRESLVPKADCRAIAQSLFEPLRYVTTENGLMRSNGLRYEIVDDILHFFVNFNIKVILEKEPVDKMQKIEREGNLSGD
ncbi:hypothetical protein P5G65_04870 [Paenibacillus chondroitinus]|uniref:Phage protein n=1 Tax=Paenibacillus chondroitinus TaxID=59842 RepID=A0ABU6D8H3_9BACL|nr:MULTISPECIES: hypothetical protein [Paenibacillus]MCY9658120.1 hypothetical protein [Paenibacillus anseongense]MEB4793218.1 hypothetical protein [Paenibacillus chondroitinus]